MLVAVYGSLKKGKGNHSMLRHSEWVADEWLTGYKMYDLGSFPGIRPSLAGEIVVELYHVDEDTLDSLDWLEGYQEGEEDNNHYNRVTVPTSKGNAYLYVYNNDDVDAADLVMNGVW